jgi:hypothetical protein
VLPCFFRLQQYKVVEMKLLAQQREHQVLLFGLILFRDANLKYDYIHDYIGKQNAKALS